MPLLASRRCYKKHIDGGLVVITFTGVDRDAICKIGDRTDLKHVVRLKNLRAYETRISCSAQIAEPGLVRFEQQPKADDTWTAKYTLGSFEEHAFPRVTIVSGSPKGEERRIDVRVEIDRRQRGTTENTSLHIFVTS